MSLRKKILDNTQPVILYELIPPTHEIEGTSLNAYIDCAIDLLTSSPIVIDAVNIPEIREEEQKVTQRPQEEYLPKMNPGYFAQLLEQASYSHLEVILNHCTVYEPWDEQLKWFDVSIKEQNIRVFILVGGSSSKISYPGPSVIEMAQFLQTHYQQELFCGGITIQSRRYHDPDKDEPFRLLKKGAQGLEFFTSQIIYEPLSIKLLLKDYAKACIQNGVSPKRIFLSFAPISTRHDLDFLRWLGTKISKTTEQILLQADIGVGWRSAKIAVSILQEILHFMREENIHVPIGLNIEHITRHNFELSLEFIERLGKLYYDYGVKS